MFCPACKKVITEATSNCLMCGFEFGSSVRQKLDLYFILKNELDNLTSSGKQLYLQIQSLSGKITEYQKEIQEEISALTQESRKEPVATEKPIPVEKAR